MISYNITNAETLCIHCQGWGKVLENQNDKNSNYLDCKTCNGELIIKSKKVADILGKCNPLSNKKPDSSIL
jgi:DNA-directed RNA polymerase subunit RPC12/RpoP